MHMLSAIEIRDKFYRKEFSAQEITETYLSRIQKYDDQIGAFLAVFSERALAKAKKLDEKLAKGEKLGKLAGIPIAIKDNIHVKGEITTCASKFLTHYRAPFDSTVARLLDVEDAIIIGKTNLDEFAMGSSTENSALQITRNPWNLKCSPGGSSGGSAAAVAARLCPLALGSDTGGSVRQPAAMCGVVGFKPTYGRVSRYGLVALAPSLDQIGPLAVNVSDAALLMEVIGVHCDQDSTSIPMPSESYLSAINGSVKGMKIGVPWLFLEGLDLIQKAVFDQSLDVLKKLGVEVVNVDLGILKYSSAVYNILAAAEASINLPRFDGIRHGHRSAQTKTLEEMFEFSKEEGFGYEVKRRILLGVLALSSGHQKVYYKKCLQLRTLIIQRYKEAFQQCDLVATPVSPFATFEIGSMQDPLQMDLAGLYTIGANLAGLPAISIPAGFCDGCKPIGLQLIGPQKGDARVFHVARAFEQVTEFHKAIPSFVK